MAGRRPASDSPGPGRFGDPTRRAQPRRTGRGVARRVANSRRYGRARAAARIERGRYEPHPGLENFLPPGRLRDQDTALRVVEALIDAQTWRADRKRAWRAILRRLVCSMDWSSGLVAAVRAEEFAAAGDRATRTVSRVIAWAVEAGFVVVAERAASAAFLGTGRGRTPTYALYVPADVTLTSDDAVDGDLPTVCLSTQKPLRGRRPLPAHTRTHKWPVFGVPQTPSDRTKATTCLLERLGLDRGRVSRVHVWRARAQLKRWWDAGACPAGLLFAVDHHPDRPDRHRGDAFRGARDPLRVLGYRLKPWTDRLHELPITEQGIPGDYTAAWARNHPADPPSRTSRETPVNVPVSSQQTPAANPAPPKPAWQPTSSAEHRARLRAEFTHRRRTHPPK
ncbi:hypothetical protein GCM10023321_80270 [Pseudonocardia eucalypti]|uniref:Replication protein n=1 Tax=Pseudonocardia eucalypti TaxID=648755 RepID=A0ABP9RCJ9_9PSEU|nr:hypothetical protein [Pseudonocardia eucalypti]